MAKTCNLQIRPRSALPWWLKRLNCTQKIRRRSASSSCIIDQLPQGKPHIRSDFYLLYKLMSSRSLLWELQLINCSWRGRIRENFFEYLPTKIWKLQWESSWCLVFLQLGVFEHWNWNVGIWSLCLIVLFSFFFPWACFALPLDWMQVRFCWKLCRAMSWFLYLKLDIVLGYVINGWNCRVLWSDSCSKFGWMGG